MHVARIIQCLWIGIDFVHYCLIVLSLFSPCFSSLKKKKRICCVTFFISVDVSAEIDLELLNYLLLNCEMVE